jgi:hypothetical protein
MKTRSLIALVLFGAVGACRTSAEVTSDAGIAAADAAKDAGPDALVLVPEASAPPVAAATDAPPIKRDPPVTPGVPFDRVAGTEAKLPVPGEAEWKKAQRVTFVHDFDKCEAFLTRGWLRVACGMDCDKGASAVALAEPVGWKIETGGGEVVIPLRQGGSYVAEIACTKTVGFYSQGNYGQELTAPTPLAVVSASWVDTKGPIVSVTSAVHPDDEVILKHQSSPGWNGQ